MFDYDPKKSQLNKEKHGLSLEDATLLWDTDHIIIPAKNMADEERYLILGMINKCMPLCLLIAITAFELYHATGQTKN